MKKINVNKSTVYCRTILSLKNSLDHLKEEGFFSDFEDFSQYKEGVLKSVIMSDDIGYPYTCKGDNGYKYFIPKDKVVFEEEPKKLRPYGINEFFDKFTMLSRITFREKGNNDCIITCVVNGYRTRPICIDVCLGVEWISLGTLFDKYEYQDTLGNWLPFGVEENEED